MELDARTATPGTRLDGAVCVIGAGPVGLAIAETLRARGVEVVVLESGTAESDERARDLNAGESVEGSYPDLRDVRARGVGGTAAIWNTVLQGVPVAKYVPLDEMDFEARPWIPYSGWPFGRDVLDPWYRRARDICGLDPHRSTEAPDPHEFPLLSFPDGALRTAVYHCGPASRFTEALPARLSAAPKVMLLRGATATEIVWEPGGDRIREIHWRTFGDGAGTVRASAFVLAAGGLENARLLLLGREDRKKEQRDGWLGAGFMEHPVDTTFELVTRAPALASPDGFYSTAGIGAATNVVARIALAHELLREERLANASIRLAHVPNPPIMRAPSIRTAAHSLVPGSALRRMIGGAARRIWRSAAPMVGATYRVLIALEQTPSKENRLALSSQRDAFGRRRLRVHWRWTARDEADRRRILTLVQRELDRAGVGGVRRVRSTPPDPAHHHHMGTTRMHVLPSEGVVDADLRVHGTENLYVAGSSVFPTGGWANPTLTAIALAVRLAEHLAGA